MKPIFAVTMGDPCGIGPEIIIKAITNHPEINDHCQLVVCGSAEILKKSARDINISADIHLVDEKNLANELAEGINCLDINPILFHHQYGKILEEAGKHSFAYIEKAIQLSMGKKVQGLVTAPINKESLKAGAVPYLDHTEMLTKLTDSSRTMTLFVTGNLRVFFYSRHITFRQISDALDKNKLVQMSEKCIEYLKQIQVKDPKLAIAALNPHGGEHGMFGDEEINILIPAVEAAHAKGLRVDGPIPADSVFHLAKEGYFDAVLSLYHDQGHIAAKTYDFYHTISLTMGLPFLRTSVDHGTAMDMAGKNIANEISMVEAIKAAAKYAW